MEKMREMRGMSERLNDLEEQQEDINLESLEGKETVSVAEIIKTIKNLQAELTRKTVSQTDLSFIRQQMYDIEKSNELYMVK